MQEAKNFQNSKLVQLKSKEMRMNYYIISNKEEKWKNGI